MIRANKKGTATGGANYNFIECSQFSDTTPLNSVVTPTARTNRKFIVICNAYNNGTASFSDLSVSVNGSPITATKIQDTSYTGGAGFVAEFESDTADAITIQQSIASGFGWYALQEVY